MDNDSEKLYGFFQGTIYFSLLIEFLIFVFPTSGLMPGAVTKLLGRIASLSVYDNIFYSKLLTLGLTITVSVGTRAKKNIDFHLVKHVILPLCLGLACFFGSLFLYIWNGTSNIYYGITVADLSYLLASLLGIILINVSLDNISKHVQAGLLKDRFNVDNESFDQNRKLVKTEYSVNIPIQFYYKRKINNGWMNIPNPFRATLLIGTPGSGKTYSIIIPFIKQLLAKGFSALVYDFKYPDLARLTYYHYLLNKRKGALKNHKFHVINLNQIEYSKRVNPLKPQYVKNLADAVETSDALLQALRKVDSSSGTDQFFTQSAINMLSCVIYFLSRYEGGRYSTLPHVLSFMNLKYEEMFTVLYTEPELKSLLSPFKSAHDRGAYDQLEGQLGTLKINISRLATKETFWVFSGDDVNLKISDPEDPSILIIANDPDTQEINSACYSVVLNRLTKLVNKKGNNPVSLIIDEVPTLYIHRVENLIATARSNRVAILLGLQELPQFEQQYGKQTSSTIKSVIANIIAGQIRNKETLDWLEKIFGRVGQLKNGVSLDRSRTSVTVNEQRDNLIPASKMASLQAGQLVAQIAQEAGKLQRKHTHSMYNCKVNFNHATIANEEKMHCDLPKFYNFGSEQRKEQVLTSNLRRIYRDVDNIVNAST